MPVTAKFHQSPPLRRPSPPYVPAQQYVPPTPDPVAELQAAKANELLNLRSKNISNIIGQRQSSPFDAKAAIAVPPADPRVEALHKDLGIDKVVLVKCPFNIDTTPGGQWQNPLLTQDMTTGGKGKLRDSWMPGFRDVGHDENAEVRVSAVEYSSGGVSASACVDGRLLRGGWAVQ